jgi:hypothetical protein
MVYLPQRTAVWSEPEMVEAGAYEFADTEKFVAIGEAIMTPYGFRPSASSSAFAFRLVWLTIMHNAQCCLTSV